MRLLLLLKILTFIGIFKTIPLSKAYARKCHIKKIGINRGYVCGDLFASDISAADQIAINDGWTSFDDASHFYYEIYYFALWLPNDNGIWAYNAKGKKRLLDKKDRLI